MWRRKFIDKENKFRKQIINYLRKQENVIRVDDRHSSIEFGIDIVFEQKDIFGKPRLYGIQLKSCDITSSNRKGAKNIKEIIGQLAIAFGHRFSDKFLDGIYVITMGEINTHAQEYIESARLGFREIYFLDKYDIERILIGEEASESILKET